jgi:FixJ family two-component response regulator
MSSRILIVDDDPGTVEGYGDLLRASGYEVYGATSGDEALRVADAHVPHVVIADLRLPDLTAIDLLRALRERGCAAAVVVVTGFGTTRTAVEAVRLGACDYVEKPLIGDALIAVVENALNSRPPTRAAVAEEAAALTAHAAARWATVVVKTIDSPTDPKHFHGWARCVGASAGTLRRWCRSARLSPKRSLDFARLLRVVVHRRQASPEHLLDAVDVRTLSRLLKLGRETSGEMRFPRTVDEFLNDQRWITDAKALHELTLELRRHPRTSGAAAGRRSA